MMPNTILMQLFRELDGLGKTRIWPQEFLRKSALQSGESNHISIQTRTLHGAVGRVGAHHVTQTNSPACICSFEQKVLHHGLYKYASSVEMRTNFGCAWARESIPRSQPASRYHLTFKTQSRLQISMMNPRMLRRSYFHRHRRFSRVGLRGLLSDTQR